jgi:hypothetical protein
MSPAFCLGKHNHNLSALNAAAQKEEKALHHRKISFDNASGDL